MSTFEEWEQTIKDAYALGKQIKSRPLVTEFKKGMILQVNVYSRQGTAVEVLRTNKKSLTVRKLGIMKELRPKEGSPKYVPMSDRKALIDISALVDHCYEMSRDEVAFMLRTRRIMFKIDKIRAEQERMCVVGSKKYTDLKSGYLLPRDGDFVKSRLTGLCGIVIKKRIYQDTLGYGLIVVDANGADQFIEEYDVLWIAPKEWE